MEMFNQDHKPARCLWHGVIAFLLLIFLSPAARGQYREEIVLRLEVRGLLEKDIFVLYDGRTVYLPLIDIFSLLDIHIKRDFDPDRFSGEFLKEEDRYEIILEEMTATSLGKSHVLDSTTFFLTETDLFLRVDMYDEIFGLPMAFDFSQLTVNLPLNKGLPAYQRLKRKAAQEKLRRKTAELKDVTRLPLQREYMKGAVADWMISANAASSSRKQYYNLNLGGVVLGGDLSVSGSGNTENPIESDQINYRWRYSFYNSEYLTQARVGQVNTQGVFSRPLKGALVTNKPVVRRKYFQTVQISDVVGEGWEVELYVNNKLVDFAYTDQSGEYNFLVDIFYGSSRIMLKLYGPNGEIQTEERYVKVPYNLVPRRTFEYSVAAGSGRYSESDRSYLQGNSYYGVLHNLTIGFNSDLPLVVPNGEKPTIAATASYQPFGSLTLGGSVAPGYAVSSNINYNSPSIISFNAGFTKYSENEHKNRLRRKHDLTLSMSSPLRLGRYYLGPRFHMSLIQLPNNQVINMSCGFSGSMPRVHLNYSTRFRINRYPAHSLRSVLSHVLLTTRLHNWINPQFRLEYDHTGSQLQTYGVNLTRRLFKTGQISVSYDHNALSGNNLLSIRFNMFTGFARFETRMVHTANRWGLNQMQRGSILYDQDAKTFRFSRQNGVGYGSAVLRPFLDDNYNGVRDDGEEYLAGMKAKIRGISGYPHGKDRIYYYDRLRPYDTYVVGVDQYSLDNPLLKPAHENYRVTFNPNMVTSINVPLVIGGEISGVIRRRVGDTRVGIGGIRVFFLETARESITEVMTFNNGDYYFLGLLPGKYRAYVDPDQLQQYGYRSQPEEIKFEVKPVDGGAVVDNVDFLLIPR